MLVDLQQVPREGLTIDCTVNPSTLPLDPRECHLAAPVGLRGRLVPGEGRSFRMHGEMSAAVEVPCARCLEPLEIMLREKLELLYLPQSRNVAPAGQEDRGLDEDELAVSFYKGEEIDLTQVVWEQIVLTLPMRPLCREDCAGLCPQCGVNRNEEQCSCTTEFVDPRWEALQSLLEPERVLDGGAERARNTGKD